MPGGCAKAMLPAEVMARMALARCFGEGMEGFLGVRMSAGDFASSVGLQVRFPSLELADRSNNLFEKCTCGPFQASRFFRK
jgi:hypothetical protein